MPSSPAGNISPAYARYVLNTRTVYNWDYFSSFLSVDEYDCLCCEKGVIAGIRPSTALPFLGRRNPASL
jgi:hypothetical protein